MHQSVHSTDRTNDFPRQCRFADSYWTPCYSSMRNAPRSANFFRFSSVRKCHKQIYQGVNLWWLCERKIAGRESSRKSFAKEPQTCAAKAARKQFYRLTSWSVFEHCSSGFNVCSGLVCFSAQSHSGIMWKTVLTPVAVPVGCPKYLSPSSPKHCRCHQVSLCASICQIVLDMHGRWPWLWGRQRILN